MPNGHMTPAEKTDYARATVAAFAADFWRDRAWQLSQMLPFADPTSLLLDAHHHVPNGDEWLTHGLEPQQWLLMARAGLGLVTLPPDPEDAELLRGEIYEVCQALAEWLFSIPGQAFYSIPTDWAEHPLGQLWHLAMIWIAGDQLITVAEAAKLAGVTTQAISGRITRGTLKAYIDPNAPQQQGRRLIRRSDLI